MESDEAEDEDIEEIEFWVVEPWAYWYAPNCFHTIPDCHQITIKDIPRRYLGRQFVPKEMLEKVGEDLWFCGRCADEYCKEYGYGK
ncbi:MULTISPECIES: hypothetical protein [Halorussus]|uniref:hypothetical protein n=1 Tax=Halorussus TaxID=1070314 RepID=UPI0013B434F2|nr:MULTISPECIES: hypothetical protein [Halorussus]NHN58318.1 hypothetical protein [Halorussus sp. JP-T4]